MPLFRTPSPRTRIEFSDGRALEHPDLRMVSTFLLLPKGRPSFLERPAFTAEREMAMVLRR